MSVIDACFSVDELAGSKTIISILKLNSLRVMKKLFVGLLLVSQTAFAQVDKDVPTHVFDIGRMNRKITLNIITVDDPVKSCAEISKKFNFGWTQPSESCAYWTTDFKECTLILARRTTMHHIGHEMLHCMIGNWH